MSRPARAAGWAAALACAVAATILPAPDHPRPAALALRLAGPIAGAAASAQWVRVDLAVRAGRTDLALSRAETAFALDPGATEGWVFLARHLAFDRGSREREPDPRRRLAWVRAGLELAERGERSARDPADLALWQGVILSTVATTDPDLPWEGGEAEPWERAAVHFARAAELGSGIGDELARRARVEARRARAAAGG